MTIKRKRSFSDFSPESNASTSSERHGSPSPTSPYGIEKALLALDGSYDADPWPTSRNVDAWQMSGRTMKRYRDNRPSEKIIHENTMHKLYDAQKRDPQPFSLPAIEPAVAENPILSAPQKSTLHAFWRLPAPSRHSPAWPIDQSQSVVLAHDTRCEDCDCSLRPTDMMDVDVDGQDVGHACHACQRKVCDRCAVTTEERLCLECAGHKMR
ncbi:hypothetical protein EV356DRAFT_122603 [Viridothelium virens]|uniref:Uncharacterized protein n=1 Tax=Viridothelium virens TaxID=1048519 RepID=A0A6A6HAX0_VIRVR|nr:hypothetical protein EV356DRAFT_122603 [Viridothelium virens]